MNVHGFRKSELEHFCRARLFKTARSWKKNNIIPKGKYNSNQKLKIAFNTGVGYHSKEDLLLQEYLEDHVEFNKYRLEWQGMKVKTEPNVKNKGQIYMIIEFVHNS